MVFNYGLMTRYALARETAGNGLQYVAATYCNAGDGVIFTPMRTDAGMYVTVEKAAQVCRALQQNSYPDLLVVPVEEA